MEYTIQQLASLAGISTRTLRYYNQIGLLNPARINQSGYRLYSQNEVDALQQILFYRQLGVGLSDIQKIVNAADFDRLDALKEHLLQLQAHQRKLNLLVKTVKNTILKEEGKRTMTDQEKFEGLKKELILENEKKYGIEIRESYGDDCVNKSNAKMMNLTEQEYNKMQNLASQLQASLEQAVKTGIRPDSPEGSALAKMHREWLSFTWPKYSQEAHAGLVQMYVEDKRFQDYYDKNLAGCAEFLRDAVVYALNN